MAENPLTHGPEQEIAELREEVRRIREEQERLKRNGNNHPGKDGDQSDQKKASDQGNSERNGKQEEKQEKKSGNQNEEEPNEEEEDQEEKKPHPLRNAILIGVGLLVVLIGLGWWLHARNFESTDDATVDGHISGIASRISGTVAAVYVEENQFVRAGEVVVDLDPRDNQVALEQARSQLLQAEGQAQAEQPNVPLTETTNKTDIATSGAMVTGAQAGVSAAEQNYQAALEKIAEAEANRAKAQADVERYRPLAEKDEVPREQFDQVVANAKSLAATVAANQAAAGAARKQIAQAREQLRQAEQRAQETRQNAPRQVAIRQANLTAREGNREAAQAQVDQAQLNLTYCKIVTPVSGVVAKRIAEVGQHLAPGQQVLLVTQTDDLWITANFKETQLRLMRAGQSVRIHVDALDADFDGYVESLPAASGPVTSLLPPENATGNFVKIVQRLPVRIRFKQGQDGLVRLRPGMSVEPKIRVR